MNDPPAQSIIDKFPCSVFVLSNEESEETAIDVVSAALCIECQSGKKRNKDTLSVSWKDVRKESDKLVKWTGDVRRALSTAQFLSRDLTFRDDKRGFGEGILIEEEAGVSGKLPTVDVLECVHGGGFDGGFDSWVLNSDCVDAEIADVYSVLDVSGEWEMGEERMGYIMEEKALERIVKKREGWVWHMRREKGVSEKEEMKEKKMGNIGRRRGEPVCDCIVCDNGLVYKEPKLRASVEGCEETLTLKIRFYYSFDEE